MVKRCREEASPGVKSGTRVIHRYFEQWIGADDLRSSLPTSFKSLIWVQKVQWRSSSYESKLIIAVLLSSHVFQDLEQKFSQQEHDALIVKNMKAELARFPKMERELRQLREENAYFRWNKGSVVERVILCSLVPAAVALYALSNSSIKLPYGKLRRKFKYFI